MKCKGKGEIPSSILGARTLFGIGMMETDVRLGYNTVMAGSLPFPLFKNSKLHGSRVVGLKTFFALLRATVFPLLPKLQYPPIVYGILTILKIMHSFDESDEFVCN